MKAYIAPAMFILSLAAIAGAQTAPTIEPNKANYLRIAAEVETSLQNDDLKKFFPASLDTSPAGGGYYENFSENWTHVAPGGGRGRRGAAAPAPAADAPINDPARSIVYQSRLTWLAAQAAERYPAQAAEYLQYTRHGAKFLMEKQWDKKNGGFWWTANSDGTARGDSKHVYGESFAIYALAASYKATHDQAALDAAKAGFMWLEKFSHDDKNGGYYEQLNGDGSHQTTGGNDIVGARPGQKSMNSHIHLLESFTELLLVWPDPLVKQRTEELYQINLNKIYAEPGYLRLFFSADWVPVESPDSYGHDIESAFLFADAAAALGKPDDPACWKAGKNIVDHCLAVAFNHTSGYLNGEGTLDGKGPMKANLEWWVEAESLNALLLMHERYGKEDPKYWNAFVKQWAFIQDHLIDKTNGGWYKGVSTSLVATRGNKTDMWTEGYHQGRSMMNVTNRLKNLASK